MATRLTTYVVVAIVSATLIAGLIVGAQRDDDGPVDLIVHNARVYTADADRSMAEAIAIRGNQILRVGSDREINRLRRAQTTVIDARGAAVLPGFNDAHVHLIQGGLTLGMLDLHDAATAAALAERVAAWAAANPGHTWIRARRWMAVGFEGIPNRQALDAAVPDRPVHVLSDDGGVAWLNSRALELAGITSRTPNPAGGTIVRDARGEPTGVLRGRAARLVERVLPRPGPEERARALRAAVKAANRHGITSVQTAGDTREDLELYDAARQAGDLTIRIYGALALSAAPFTDADTSRLDDLAKKYPDDPHFKTGIAALTIDHEGDRVGARAESEGTDPDGGRSLVDPDDLNRNVRLLDAHGWQVASHASGEQAVHIALNAYAHAVRSNAKPPRGRRHRLEHTEAIAEEDAARLDRLDVITSLLPRREPVITPHANAAPERAAPGTAVRQIAAAGGRIALGSDWPQGTLDPLSVLQAVTEPAAPAPFEEAGPASRMKLLTAIDAFTSNAAYASFDEQRKGSITPGMLADIVVLTDDIFTEPLESARVAVTIFDGKIVYRRGASTTSP